MHQQARADSAGDQDSEDANAQQSGDELDIDDTEPLHNGKRKRPMSVSCELCKQRKVKCDRGQPKCGWCNKNNAICEYKERKKPGLRAGYGRELEQRLDRLEDILNQHSEILYARPSPRNPHSGSLTGSNHGTPLRPVESPQAEGLFAQQGQQGPYSAPTPQQPIQYGLPQLTPGGHGVVTPMGGPQVPPPPPPPQQKFFPPGQSLRHRSTVIEASPSSSQARDLPYEVVYNIIHLYFEHIHPWCPILHKANTLHALFTAVPREEEDQILLHAIITTTLRFTNDQRVTEDMRRHHHDLSKQKVLLYGMEHSTVKALQALVILALDLIGDSNGPPGWNIMALITRAVVQLGLSMESYSLSVSSNTSSIYTLRAMILPDPKDFVEEESRRRLFWMIYLLDRYATIATAFEFALDDKEINRTLPCRDQLWEANQKVETRPFRTDGAPLAPQDLTREKTESLSSFSYYIEVLGILSKIHNFLKEPVDIHSRSDVKKWQEKYRELDGRLNRWLCSLPKDYDSTPKLIQPSGRNRVVNSGWFMLHATYHTAVIRLHSSAAYPSHSSASFQRSAGAAQYCADAVREILRLTEHIVNSGILIQFGPPFAFTLWVAARVLLVQGSTESSIPREIGFFVNCLRDMGHYWPVAGRYSELLERVLDEHQDSERQGDGITPNSVSILKDMRHTAFNLELLISRAPRHSATTASSRMPSVTPAARTPAPQDLALVDVFDFFNYPRVPFPPEMGPMPPGMTGAENLQGQGSLALGHGPSGVPGMGDFGIGNFPLDGSNDWLFKDGGAGSYMPGPGV